MIRTRLIRIALGLLLALTVWGCSTKSDLPVGAQLQTVLDEAVSGSDGQIPGAVLYIHREGDGAWAGAAGLSNIDQDVAMGVHDRFRAGSILKTFIATVVLQLSEEGKLGLDDPVSALLPRDTAERIPNGNEVTVRMLLNHTTGIPDWLSDSLNTEITAHPDRIYSVSDYLSIAASSDPLFSPGERWSYSNTNYNILGVLIETTTGQSWRQAVRDRVLRPIGLKDTRLPEPGDTVVPDGHARGYHYVDGVLADLTRVDPSMAGAAGGHALETTTRDLAAFLDALRAGGLFRSPSTLQEMLTWVDTPNEHGFPYHYGLGVDRWEFPGGTRMIGHFGTTAGFTSAVYYLPDRGITISAAINTMDPEQLFTKVLLPAVDIVASHPGSLNGAAASAAPGP